MHSFFVISANIIINNPLSKARFFRLQCEAKKLHRFIFAIALSELHLLRQFLAHIYFNKFPIINVFYILYIIRDGEPAEVLKVQRATAPCSAHTVILQLRRETSIIGSNL